MDAWINYLHATFQVNILKDKKVIKLLELWQLWRYWFKQYYLNYLKEKSISWWTQQICMALMTLQQAWPLFLAGSRASEWVMLKRSMWGNRGVVAFRCSCILKKNLRKTRQCGNILQEWPSQKCEKRLDWRKRMFIEMPPYLKIPFKFFLFISLEWPSLQELPPPLRSSARGTSPSSPPSSTPM